MTLLEILNMTQRRKMAMSLRKNKSKIKMGKQRASRRVASMDKLKGRAVKHARGLLIKKLTKGIPKGELSVARKVEIEKKLVKMKPRIAIIAKKLLPAIRKAELEKKRGKDVRTVTKQGAKSDNVT